MTDKPDEYKVELNFFVVRSRNQYDEYLPLAGSCGDVRWHYRNTNSYLLTQRIITPKWNGLLSKSVNVFPWCNDGKGATTHEIEHIANG